jgi:hypothetical protein
LLTIFLTNKRLKYKRTSKMSGITPQRSRAGQIFTPAREYNPLASRNFGSTNIRTGTPTRTVQQQPQQQVVRQAAPV